MRITSVTCEPCTMTQEAWDSQRPGTLETLTAEEHLELAAALAAAWEAPTR